MITRSFMALPDCIRAPAQVIVPCTMLLAFSKMAPEFLSYSIESVTKFYRCFSPYFSSQSLRFHFQGLPESWPDLPEYITPAASNTAKKRGESGCLHLMLSLIGSPLISPECSLGLSLLFRVVGWGKEKQEVSTLTKSGI